MSTIIAVDGALSDGATAKISVLDRGFLYGDSVYEVIRTYRGRPFLLDEHLARLARSASLLGIQLPLEPPALAREIDEVLAAAANPESYIRAIVTRGAGPIGLDPALAERPCRVVIVTELPQLPPELYERGAAISLIAGGRAEGAMPKGAKSGNYLVNIMALTAARRRGAHEAVMLDASGLVTEGTSSNVFAVVVGELHTPPLSAGILEGITRRKVIALARSAGLRVHERDVHPGELFDAEEVFLTSTLREVLPVTSIDGRRVGAGAPGRLTRRLRELYRALTDDGAPQST
jgi:branched-chain amino acid aminotransferase